MARSRAKEVKQRKKVWERQAPLPLLDTAAWLLCSELCMHANPPTPAAHLRPGSPLPSREALSLSRLPSPGSLAHHISLSQPLQQHPLLPTLSPSPAQIMNWCPFLSGCTPSQSHSPRPGTCLAGATKGLSPQLMRGGSCATPCLHCRVPL